MSSLECVSWSWCLGVCDVTMVCLLAVAGVCGDLWSARWCSKRKVPLCCRCAARCAACGCAACAWRGARAAPRAIPPREMRKITPTGKETRDTEANRAPSSETRGRGREGRSDGRRREAAAKTEGERPGESPTARRATHTPTSARRARVRPALSYLTVPADAYCEAKDLLRLSRRQAQMFKRVHAKAVTGRSQVPYVRPQTKLQGEVALRTAQSPGSRHPRGWAPGPESCPARSSTRRSQSPAP